MRVLPSFHIRTDTWRWCSPLVEAIRTRRGQRRPKGTPKIAVCREENWLVGGDRLSRARIALRGRASEGSVGCLQSGAVRSWSRRSPTNTGAPLRISPDFYKLSSFGHPSGYFSRLGAMEPALRDLTLNHDVINL